MFSKIISLSENLAFSIFNNGDKLFSSALLDSVSIA